MTSEFDSCLGMKNIALERFNMLVNTPSLPSHHFSHPSGWGGGGNQSFGSDVVDGPAAVGRGQRDQRSPMKVTNFDPGQDYKTLVRQHSSTRLFEVGETLFNSNTEYRYRRYRYR